MYKSEAPIGNGLSARIHQLNGNSAGSSGLTSKRRSQSFLSRPPASTSSPSTGLLSGGGGSTTHNNNQPFSYINGNNDYNRHNPSNYYSLDRRGTSTAQPSPVVSNGKPIIYSQVLPKDQRPKKSTANHHHSTMTTTIGDDRHIHHYVYENPNKENRTKLKTSHLSHDLHSHRPTKTQYRNNGNVTKVFINGDNSTNNYSGTDEQDEDVLAPFSKKFSSMPRNTATSNGYHSYNGSANHDLNSSGNTTTTTSTSYYNTNGSNNRYTNDYLSRGNNFDSSLASSSREASPSPPFYSSSRPQRYTTPASNLVRDAERRREQEYTVPSAKLVRTYMFTQNGNGVDDEDYEITDPIPLSKPRQPTSSYQDEEDSQFRVQNRRRATNNLTSRINENGHADYKYSYMDDNDHRDGTGRHYEKRATFRPSNSNGHIYTGAKYGENLTSRRFSNESAPQINDHNRGVLKTSTIRKLTTPASNGNGYRAKSESLLVPERRQTTIMRSNTNAQPKSPPSSGGNNFLSTLMRSKKSKSAMNVASESGNAASTKMRPETGKPPAGTKNRGNILAILLRKATSSKDSKDKSKGKPTVSVNGTHTLKKASSIPKIITDSEIEEVERRRDSGAYYSWSTPDLYGNRNDDQHTYLGHSVQSIDFDEEDDEDEDDNGADLNRPTFQHSVRFATIEPSNEYPPTSDYYWNHKENDSYNYDDMSDYRRELATTSKPLQPMTNTNTLKKSVTLGRPPNKTSGSASKSNFASTTSTSYYPTSAMSLDRRLLNKKTPKIVVTDDSGEQYMNHTNKVKPAGRSMSFFNLRPKTQNATTTNSGAVEGSKKWNFGFMNKSKRGNPPSSKAGGSETSFRYFGDTDVEDLPNRNRSVLRANKELRNRKITYSEDDDASRTSKSNGMYLGAFNGNGSTSSASPYVYAKRNGTLQASQSHKYNPTMLPGASSATESEVDLPLPTEMSQKSSNGATVFLHAATIAEIPPASPLPLHERAMSRDELSTIHSGTGSQIETHKLSRSVSVLAPWRPKIREGSEINYNSSDGMRSDYSKKPPRPYSLANRSTSSTSISPIDYANKGRNGSSYGEWKKQRNGSVNSSDSLRLPKHHSHRTSSPSLLLPPPPSGPKRVRQPQPQQPMNGQSQKSATLSRSKSMIDSTGDRNPRNKSGWSPFRRSKP